MTLKTFTVRMSEWGADYLKGPSFDDGSGGKMCCLGFAAEQCGILHEDLVEVTMPNDLDPINMPVELTAFNKAIAEIPGMTARKRVYATLDAIYYAEGNRFNERDAWTVMGDPTTSYMHLMAKVNDAFHALAPPQQSHVRSIVREGLTYMFNQCGYDLTFVP